MSISIFDGRHQPIFRVFLATALWCNCCFQLFIDFVSQIDSLDVLLCPYRQSRATRMTFRSVAVEYMFYLLNPINFVVFH